MIRRSYDSFTIFRNSMWIKELFLGFVIYHIFHFYIYIYILKKQSNSFITEDFLCLCAEVLLFCLKTQTKKKWRKHICPKNITFMSTDKRSKSESRYKKNQHNQWIVNIKISFIIKC